MTAIVHHWDTDGICSAALIKDEINEKNVENFTPRIGNYELSEKDIQRLENHEKVYIVDLNLSRENLRQIRGSIDSYISFFDHHESKKIDLDKFEFNNPVTLGSNPERYPSNTWVLSEKLNRETDLLKILGAIGDREGKIKNNNKAFKEIKRYLEGKDVSFEDLEKAVNLLDSSYKMNKKTEVEKSVKIAEDSLKNGIKSILSNKKLNNNLEEIDREIERWTDIEDSDSEEILVRHTDSSYNIISSVTRKLAWNLNRTVIVINEGFFDDKDQIYVRTSEKDLRPLISELKKKWSLGGKKDVIGSVIPKEDRDEFLSRIENYLEKDSR